MPPHTNARLRDHLATGLYERRRDSIRAMNGFTWDGDSHRHGDKYTIHLMQPGELNWVPRLHVNILKVHMTIPGAESRWSDVQHIAPGTIRVKAGDVVCASSDSVSGAIAILWVVHEFLSRKIPNVDEAHRVFESAILALSGPDKYAVYQYYCEELEINPIWDDVLPRPNGSTQASWGWALAGGLVVGGIVGGLIGAAVERGGRTVVIREDTQLRAGDVVIKDGVRYRFDGTGLVKL